MINQKKIIIGKSTTISNLLIKEIPYIQQISHSLSYTFDFSSFDEIYFVGWNNKAPMEVLGLLNWVDLKKVIFFSSISVFSIQLRPQWANYPKFKLSAENLVLQGGGKVIRLGRIIDASLPKPYFSKISPVTPIFLLVEYMLSNNKERIKNLFFLSSSNTGLPDKLSSLALHRISRVFPSQFLFQAPFAALAKVLGINSYGYGSDAERSMLNSIQIGFGALGSAYYLSLIHISEPTRPY